MTENDKQYKTATERLLQLKSQLNLSESVNSIQAPKDIERERNACDFNIKELTYFYHGGKQNYEKLQKAYEFIRNDPELVVQHPRNFLELSQSEMRSFTMGQIFRIINLIKESKDKDNMDMILLATSMYSESFVMRYSINEALFKNAIFMLGSEEQQEKYLDDIINFRVIGCFAMTELGHSSDLPGLETTATYDKTTDEFIINSPTITSTKWWIGMAGQTATHSAVIAQTIIDGKNVGLNWFVVQLRSKYTGELEPNVQVGDVGKKVGHSGVDNGWIQFHHKRVPRSDMLNKWARLDENGKYIPPQNLEAMYVTLIPERLMLVELSKRMVIRALTISTRYSVVRRQGRNNEQIIDYQSNYARTVPAIAFTYITYLALDIVNEQYSALITSVEKDQKTYLNSIKYMHAISSGLKGFTGGYITEILEICRRNCGGHAYSSYNGLGQIIGDWGVMTTGGGDNVVLLQQTARYLIGILDKQISSNEYTDLGFKSSTHYIKDAQKYLAATKWNIRSVYDGFYDQSLLHEALHTILVKQLNSIRIELQTKENNALLLNLVRVAELHCAVYSFSACYDKFGKSETPQKMSPDTHNILKKLNGLWGIHVLYTYGDLGFKEEYITAAQMKSIETVYFDICKSFRHQVIGLTDCYGLPDFILKAPIAKYDGNIYQSYFNAVLSAPQSTGIPLYFSKYIKPLTEQENPNIKK